MMREHAAPLYPQVRHDPHACTTHITAHAPIDGATDPLTITGASLNEVHKAVRLLQANNLIVAPPSASPCAPHVDHYPTHAREPSASKKPGVKFCPAQNDDGSYYTFKVKG